MKQRSLQGVSVFLSSLLGSVPVRASLALVMLLSMPHAASASLITFQFEGVIRSTFNNDGSADTLGFSAGQLVQGSMVFDDSTADQDGSSEKALFPYSMQSVSFGGISAIPPAIGASSLYIDAPFDYVAGYANAIVGNVSDVYQFQLTAFPHDLFPSDAIDLTALTLLDFTSDSSFSLQRAIYGVSGSPDVIQIEADIRSLSIASTQTPVPEPASLVLLGSGVVALCVRRRKVTP